MLPCPAHGLLKRCTLFALAGLAVCFAQPSAKPKSAEAPPNVDKALRSRITEFYQDHVEGRFRQAEALVADDSKDIFYNSTKPKYVSFEIQSIQYKDNFTKARAAMLLEQFVMLPGFANGPLKVPVATDWKLVDGKWYWYVDADALQSPFGAPHPNGAPGATPFNIPSGEDVLKQISTQVKVDKSSIELKAGRSGDVLVTNGLPGVISLSVTGTVPGIEITPAHSDVQANATAKLTVHATGKAQSGTFNVVVQQTGQTIPIKVTIE